MEQNEEQAAFILPLIGEVKHLTFVGEDLLLDITDIKLEQALLSLPREELKVLIIDEDRVGRDFAARILALRDKHPDELKFLEVAMDTSMDIPSLDNIHYIRAMDQIREDFDLRVNLPDPHWTPGQGAPIKRGRKGKR
jgi:hypothetical protein